MNIKTILTAVFALLAGNFALAQSSTYNVDSLAFLPYNGSFDIVHFDRYLVTSLGQVYDVANPNAPILAGSFTPQPGVLTAYHYEKPYLYVGTGGGSGSLQIIDMTFPFAPNAISTLSMNSQDVFGIAVQGNHAYLALGNVGVVSIDVSNPASPFPVDTLLFPGQVRDVGTHECHAFVSGIDGLNILDISDPANMSILGTYGTAFMDLDHYGDTVVVVGSSGGIQVIDCFSPSSPLPLAGAAVNDQLWGVGFRDGMIYTSSNSGDLYAFALTYPTLTPYAYFNGNAGQGFDVVTNDSLVFLSSLVQGVHILQLDSSAASPYPPLAGPCATVSTQNPEPKSTVQVYPNPGRGRMRMRFSTTATATTLQVYNSKGKIVLEENAPGKGEFVFDSSNWTQGVYLFRIVQEGLAKAAQTGTFLVQ